ncbi:hypothetical protein GCM10010976_27880 [Bizionia arctica]|uniref:Transposase IS200-like domain-containing protein n=2 Tax=Bizionia arctica TaxID=1495645 RepID=A0A917GSN8_9FLAO|nr:hypothetical protein GCM10010976_27880 [Bizionia arctica]
MKGFDYSSNHLYFVTICVKDRLCCFGEVVVGTARELSVQDIRNKNIINNDKIDPNPFNKIMKLNSFGLIVQDKMLWLETQYPYVVLYNFVVMPNHVHAIIEIDSLKMTDKEIKIKSLSSLVGAFKTTSSKLIHEKGFNDFSWQRSFYDHIIRTQKAYHNISNYLDMNPQKWQQDSLFLKD